MTAPGTPRKANPRVAQLGPDRDRLWASLAHFGGIVGILPSFLIFLLLRRRGSRTAIESKEALNWQITFTAGSVIVEILVSVFGGIAVSVAASIRGYSADPLGVVIGIAAIILWLVNAIFSILGFVKVNGGGSYRYPFAFRFIR